MRRVNQPLKLAANINVVPIIDVSLTLVIILLVTAPMLAVPDIDIKLPPAKAREADNDLRVSITLGANDQLAINEKTVHPRLFLPTLQSILAKDSNDGVLVVVRADQGVPYAKVEALLADARAAGATRIAIATLQGDKVKQ